MRILTEKQHEYILDELIYLEKQYANVKPKQQVIAKRMIATSILNIRETLLRAEKLSLEAKGRVS